MFGNEYDIVREFNTYFLDYQEQYDSDARWTDRIIPLPEIGAAMCMIFISGYTTN